MSKRRTDRINQSLKREISKILLTDMNDIAVKFVTINRVEVSSDLHYAKVYLIPPGEGSDKNRIMRHIRQASGFIRTRIAHSMDLRVTPEFHFIYDKAFEDGMRVLKKIDEISNQK
ncbi:MAG: 30S ribosome-binding factor RbfA [bacterium]|nr:30S ribosome-binding factor RbfA [bacterium]